MGHVVFPGHVTGQDLLKQTPGVQEPRPGVQLLAGQVTPGPCQLVGVVVGVGPALGHLGVAIGTPSQTRPAPRSTVRIIQEVNITRTG